MKIALLDDYKDVVKTLDYFKLFACHEVMIFNRTLFRSELVSGYRSFGANQGANGYH